MNDASTSQVEYEAPELMEIGPLRELTLAYCDKPYGHSNGFTFQGQSIVCTSQ